MIARRDPKTSNLLDITDSATLIGLLLASLVSAAILLTFKAHPPREKTS